MLQQGDEPPVLLVGTEVSAKYKGAFCEAKIRKVVRSVKIRVNYKAGSGPNIVSDDQIVEGDLRVGETVQIKLPDKKDLLAVTIAKIQDGSHYTVVFDDGDITTLRRSALCLKSGRHFNASETLDQLPLTHPEHFGAPVIGGRRGRRHQEESSDEEEDDEDEQPVKTEKEENIGKVVCVENTETKKKSQKENWFPGLVVAPTAQDTVRIRVKDEYLVRSFKDGRYYTVPKKEATEFTRDQAKKQDNAAVHAALEYLDKDTLPPHWDRDVLFGLAVDCSGSDVDLESDSSDDEPREEKDHFVAQLYKYMDDRGTPLNKGPQISNRDIDLYRLFRAAQKLGGYNRVTSQNQWKAIAIRLGFSPATNSITNLVKQAYKKFLQPFEDFNRKLGCTMVAHPRANRIKGRSLLRAGSVASPKPGEAGPSKGTPGNEEYENTSESSAEISGRGKKPRKLSMNSNQGATTPKQGNKFQAMLKDDPEDNVPIVQVAARGKPGPKPKGQPQQQQEVKEKEKEESLVIASPSPSPITGRKQPMKPEIVPDCPTTPGGGGAGGGGSAATTVAKTPKGRGPSESSAVVVAVTPSSAVKGGRKKKETAAVTATPATASPALVLPSSSASVAASAEVEEKPSIPEKNAGPGGAAGGEKGEENHPVLAARKEKKDSESHSGNGTNPTDKGGTLVTATTSSASTDDFPVEVGDKLKVFYHEKKVTYEAKVLEISADNLYLVHYTGWNTRYDEWVPKMRIAENLTSKQKRTKAGVISKSGNAASASSGEQQQQQQRLVHGKMGTGGSKRGRGGSRSDSLPPRSTTPCSVTSNSSRTKSPATPAQQRRTTRGQPGALRRTSNNTDVSSSMQTDDSDTDSDEPVKKPKRSASLALPPGRSVLDSMRKDSKDASSSNPEDETTKDFMEFIDIDQIRSEMKEVQKSPSPDADQSPTSSVHLDHKTSLFHLSDSNTDSNELKALKESGSSSDTQSFDEDSQGFPAKKAPPATLAAQKRKPGRKSAVAAALDKDNDKSLSKILGTDVLLDKVELVLVDVVKKGPLSGSATGKATTEKGKQPVERVAGAPGGRKSTGEKIGMPVKQEKGGKVAVVNPGKSAGDAASTTGELRKKEEASDGDVYEFKEPEPFEFEAAATTSRKPPISGGPTPTAAAVGGSAAPATGPATPEDVKVTGGPGKGKKRILDLDAKPGVKGEAQGAAAPTTAKKVKRSPGKPGAAGKKEDVASDPFDVLRKSPNFNVSGDNLPEFTQQLPSTEGFSNPVTSSGGGGGGGAGGVTNPGGLAMGGGPKGGSVFAFSNSSPAVYSAFVNTRNDDDQWQSLQTFKSAVEHQIDMEDVLAKTKVPKESSMQLQKGSDHSAESKTEVRSSIADKFLKTLNQGGGGGGGGGSSNSSSPSSSGEGPSSGVASKTSSGSIFGRDFADKLEPKMMGKKEHLKLELLTSGAGGSEKPVAGGLVGSPDKLDSMLELNPPKNNDLSETIEKLKSTINEDEDVGADESTDSERERLVIEDDDEDELEEEEDDDFMEGDEDKQEGLLSNGGGGGGGSGAKKESLAEVTLISSAEAAAAAAIISCGIPLKIKEELTISSVTLKEQSMSFASKFQESFFGSISAAAAQQQQQPAIAPGMVKAESSEMDLSCKESFDDDACEVVVDKKDVSITLVAAGATVGQTTKTLSNVVSVSMTATGGGGDKDPESLSLLLCEETIPTSPWHRGLSEKSLLEDHRKGPLESRLVSGVKSLAQTPNSSPRDSQSPDDSKSDSEDLKKTESGDPVSGKKRRRGAGRRSPDMDALSGKRRRLGAGSRKGSGAANTTSTGGGGGNGGSDSEENSDPLSTRQQLLGRRSPKPCQYNFLVQLDPSISSHQKIAILEKKIQELRKTYNMIKSDLVVIDRRRKKLRRRERETKKNQQQKASAAAAVASAAVN